MAQTGRQQQTKPFSIPVTIMEKWFTVWSRVENSAILHVWIMAVITQPPLDDGDQAHMSLHWTLDTHRVIETEQHQDTRDRHWRRLGPGDWNLSDPGHCLQLCPSQRLRSLWHNILLTGSNIPTETELGRAGTLRSRSQAGASLWPEPELTGGSDTRALSHITHSHSHPT